MSKFKTTRFVSTLIQEARRATQNRKINNTLKSVKPVLSFKAVDLSFAF